MFPIIYYNIIVLRKEKIYYINIIYKKESYNTINITVNYCFSHTVDYCKKYFLLIFNKLWYNMYIDNFYEVYDEKKERKKYWLWLN